LATAIIAAAATTARAQTAPETIELWPTAPPGAPASPGPEQSTAKGNITRVSRPRLVVYGPAAPGPPRPQGRPARWGGLGVGHAGRMSRPQRGKRIRNSYRG
ncbi:MAG: hypothetical protein ACLP5E_02035, partial [Streptosporangiaceae bacterium]